ncbi:MAG: 30S ribosome-binding factor RbfA [Herpetosiphonaceae bacterium]|nr:30S ribosome-binding factor RbfA [Herpetosiphonaceae bacterium]
MAKTKRIEQVAEQIQHILGSIIQSEIKDPRLGFVTVMSVNVSPDLYHANINVSIMGDESVRTESLATLERAKSFLRRQLAQELQLRAVPELHFHLDISLDTREQMDVLFRQLEADRRDNPPKLDEE